MNINTKTTFALIRAAQNVCQTVNGSNPEQTRVAHAAALQELLEALRAIHGESTP